MPGRGLACAASTPRATSLAGPLGRREPRSRTGHHLITSVCNRPGGTYPPGWAYFGLRETCTFDAGQTAAGILSASPVQVPPNAIRVRLTNDSVHRDAVVNLLTRLSIAGKRRACASLRPIHAGLLADRPAAVRCLREGLQRWDFFSAGKASARNAKTCNAYRKSRVVRWEGYFWRGQPSG